MTKKVTDLKDDHDNIIESFTSCQSKLMDFKESVDDLLLCTASLFSTLQEVADQTTKKVKEVVTDNMDKGTKEEKEVEVVEEVEEKPKKKRKKKVEEKVEEEVDRDDILAEVKKKANQYALANGMPLAKKLVQKYADKIDLIESVEDLKSLLEDLAKPPEGKDDL